MAIPDKKQWQEAKEKLGLQTTRTNRFKSGLKSVKLNLTNNSKSGLTSFLNSGLGLVTKVDMGDEFQKYHDENDKLGNGNYASKIVKVDNLHNKINIYITELDKYKNIFDVKIIKNAKRYLESIQDELFSLKQEYEKIIEPIKIAKKQITEAQSKLQRFSPKTPSKMLEDYYINIFSATQTKISQVLPKSKYNEYNNEFKKIENIIVSKYVPRELIKKMKDLLDDLKEELNGL